MGLRLLLVIILTIFFHHGLSIFLFLSYYFFIAYHSQGIKKQFCLCKIVYFQISRQYVNLTLIQSVRLGQRPARIAFVALTRCSSEAFTSLSPRVLRPQSGLIQSFSAGILVRMRRMTSWISTIDGIRGLWMS